MINPEMTDPVTTPGWPPVSSLDLQYVVALSSSLICGAEQVSALFCTAGDGVQDDMEGRRGWSVHMTLLLMRQRDLWFAKAFFLIKNQHTDQSSEKFLGPVGLNIIF
jgi:hypothetical protein